MTNAPTNFKTTPNSQTSPELRMNLPNLQRTSPNLTIETQISKQTQNFKTSPNL